jgi:exopolyphosphatase/guanosine-5'-triphosphate,3'-diphosphate pyrophosphatase
MEVYKVEEYMAFGTAILRQAKNKVEVIKKIKEKTGIDVKIINGQAEAKLMAKGVLSTLDISKRPILIVDIGGGSTELFWLNKKTKAISLPLGATNLTKSFLKHDPPLKTEIEHTFYKAKEVIKSTNFSTPSLLIGTAGTISTLAALDLKIKIYSPYLINGYVLEKDHISSIFLMLTSISASSRLGLRGLEEGREEIILGGTIIVLMALDVFSQNQLIVSEGGLLEGILVDYLFQKTARQYKVSYKKEDSYGNERGINL